MIEPKPIISWLVNLGDILGVAQSTFAKAETSQSFEYIDSKLPVERFLKIGIDVFEEGRRLFSDSLSITCRIGDMDVFSFSKTDWESQVRNLLATATNGQSMEFELEINKSRLLANSGIANNPGQEVTLFFWFDGFDGLFRESLCSPNVLEERLWKGDGALKAIVLVLSESVMATGTHLAILGGTEIDSLPTLGAPPQTEIERGKTIFNTAKETIRWESSWLTFLTPLHLLCGSKELELKYANLIAANAVNLGMLFTADRVIRSETEFTATYATDNYRSEVMGFQPNELPLDIASKSWRAFVELANWSMEDRWQSDRLKLLQAAYANAMAGRGQRSDARTLIEQSKRVHEDVHWRWKTFVDGKITAYIERESELESEVVKTVESFNDQSTRMIGSLSTTVLTAVGAFIGSMLIAMFKDGFNASVFALGVGTYIAYIVFLPGIYNMTHNWVTYQSVSTMFDGRLERFKRLLGDEACKSIVGEHVVNAKQRFVLWFGATVAALLIVVVLAFVAMINVESLIPPRKNTGATSIATERWALDRNSHSLGSREFLDKWDESK